jgi:hypothetical protein
VPLLVALVAEPVPVALAGVPLPVALEEVVPAVLDGAPPPMPDRLVVLAELSEQAMQTRAQAPSPRAIEKDLVTFA